MENKTQKANIRIHSYAFGVGDSGRSAKEMNQITTVDGIARKFREYVSGLDVPDYYKAFHTTPQHDGSPHIEKEGIEFHFVVTERGEEYERTRTFDSDEILYLLLDGVTSYAAGQFELKNRIEGKDGREIWFPYQEQLLSEMKPEWGERKKKEHAKSGRNRRKRKKKRLLFHLPLLLIQAVKGA